MRGVAPAAAALAMAMAACGGSSAPASAQDIVQQTSSSLASVSSGTLGMRLVMSTQHSGDVGFSLDGPFSTSGGATQANMKYTQLAGPQQRTVTFVAAHGHSFVLADGRTYQLGGTQAAPFSSSGGTISPLAGVHLERWVTQPATSGGPQVDGAATDHVTGQLDVANVLQDLRGLIVQASSPGAALPTLDSSTADQIRKQTRSASFDLLSGHDDHLLRRLDIQLEVAANVSAQQAQALGEYAGVRLALHIELHAINQQVTVTEPPGPYQSAPSQQPGG